MPRLEFSDVRVTYTTQTDAGPKPMVAVDGVNVAVAAGVGVWVMTSVAVVSGVAVKVGSAGLSSLTLMAVV